MTPWYDAVNDMLEEIELQGYHTDGWYLLGDPGTLLELANEFGPIRRSSGFVVHIVHTDFGQLTMLMNTSVPEGYLVVAEMKYGTEGSENYSRVLDTFRLLPGGDSDSTETRPSSSGEVQGRGTVRNSRMRLHDSEQA